MAVVVTRRADAAAPAVDIVGWLAGLCIPAIALGFLVGLMRWRLYVGRALGRLTIATRRSIGAQGLADTLAFALEDPALQLVYRRDDRWLDATGKPVHSATSAPTHARTELGDDTSPVAALDHDAVLCDDPEFLAAVAEWTLTAIERERALVTVNAGLNEIEQSRARLVADATTARRRIETRPP